MKAPLRGRAAAPRHVATSGENADASERRRQMPHPQALHGHDVEPHGLDGRIAGHEDLSRAPQSALLLGPNRLDRSSESPAAPRLDLADHQQAAPPGKHVDLTAGHADVAPHDPVAGEPQPPCGKALGEAAVGVRATSPRAPARHTRGPARSGGEAA